MLRVSMCMITEKYLNLRCAYDDRNSMSTLRAFQKTEISLFFSVRDPKNAMRSFGIFISKIDWSKSESLKALFLPFMYLGEEKPAETK